MLVGLRDKPGNLVPVDLFDSDIKTAAIGGPTVVKLDLPARLLRLFTVTAL
ncbi:MAG: hypothetical protein Q27BPR15_15965 [Rhodobacter sp. CACIA14H1]|nr:MAG: hypothetical protein Q27BPR15_15965 [Rhodobacter sp. CACIA14H1]